MNSDRKWKRFYTPLPVARVMVKLVGDLNPRCAVDICAGSWNLLTAAREHWPDISLVGVDSTPHPDTPCNDGDVARTLDGRVFSLECIRGGVEFDLVLANPPFGFEDPGECCQGLPGIECLGARAWSRIEATMLLANLSLMSKIGHLVAIVPRSIITGNAFYGLRSFISRNYSVKSIINLPDDTFGRDVRTSILSISAGLTDDRVPVYHSDLGGTLNQQPSISSASFIAGNWLSLGIEDEQQLPAGGQVYRGSISNSDLDIREGRPVLHTTDMRSLRGGMVLPSRWLPLSAKIYKIALTAEAGDIIVVRVGRNAGAFVSIPQDAHGLLVSDCLLLVRSCTLTLQKKALKILESQRYQSDLAHLIRGVTAKFLPISSFRHYLARRL